MDSGARPPFDPLKASADWTERLTSARVHAPLDAIDATRLDRCHQQFREISLRTRALWKRPEFQPAAIPRLARLGEQSLSLSRMICDELVAHTVNAGIFLPVPIEALEELLEANAAMIDWLTARLEMMERCAPVTTGLRHFVEEIVHGKETSSRRLRSLTSEFISLVDQASPLNFCSSADATTLSEIFASMAGPRQSWFAQSLVTAWLLARESSPRDTHSETVQRLVMAALLQDIGGWSHAASIAPTDRDPRVRILRLPPYHPSTGAAMLSGLADTPSEVTLLVGAHHERCDGSGFPQRLSGTRFSPTAQRLAWTVRFAELVLDPLTSQFAIDTGDSVDAIAGVRLWREVVRGAFDPDAARDWLQAIRTDLANEVVTLFPQYQRRFVDAAHRELTGPHTGGLEPMRVDGARTDDGVAAPQFLRRGRRLVSTIRPVVPTQRKGLPS